MAKAVKRAQDEREQQCFAAAAPLVAPCGRAVVRPGFSRLGTEKPLNFWVRLARNYTRPPGSGQAGPLVQEIIIIITQRESSNWERERKERPGASLHLQRNRVIPCHWTNMIPAEGRGKRFTCCYSSKLVPPNLRCT